MKRVLSALLTLVMIVSLAMPINANAATKLEQTKITSLVRTSKSGITLTWDKVYRAKRYQIYMKIGGGKYKKIATTSKRKYKKTGLKIGKSYCFKIRAYRSSKGKKIYGKYSAVARKKMTAYEYLVNVAEPYYKNYTYNEYKDANSQLISGRRYYNGFACYKCADDTVAIWNLSGKYSKIAFTYGNQNIEQGDTPGGCNVVYKGDDEILKKISVGAYDLSKTCEINIKGVHKFSIDIAGINAYACDYFAMGNVRLYY